MKLMLTIIFAKTISDKASRTNVTNKLKLGDNCIKRVHKASVGKHVIYDKNGKPVASSKRGKKCNHETFS